MFLPSDKMSDNIGNKNLLPKKHRPPGVWILTIHASIIALFIFGANNSIMVLKGEVAMFASDDVPFMLQWAYLCIGIIIACFLTWIGWEPGRIFFLVLTSILYLGAAENILSWITSSHSWKIAPWEIGDRIVSVFQFIGCLLSPILYIWYFNKPSTRAFYRKIENTT
jgi:hypothetical protein